MSIHQRPPTRFATLVVSATLSAVLAAAACKPKAEGKAPPPLAPAASVTKTNATAIEAPRTLRLTGTLPGERETDLAANVAGRVVSMKLERGQRIAKGELIAEVDVSA